MRLHSFTKGILSLGIFALTLFISSRSVTASNQVHIIQLEDATINPATAEYISKSIDQATEEGAQCLILELDTPGGLLNSTRSIVKKILSSEIPIIVYIYPSGSHAGSAGVFITYASHVAAMAPSTNIGAAHPIQMGGSRKKDSQESLEGLKEFLEDQKKKKNAEIADEEAKTKNTAKKKDTETKKSKAENEKELTPDENALDSKILQDTVAFIRSIAAERNRNVDWAVKSVTKSSSITETEALELKVVEILAKDESELLEKLDGRVINMGTKEITLATKNAEIRRVKMNFRQEVLNILANPNIAYILMIIGFWALLYEVTHPGGGISGVLGAIFLILAFYSMQALPTNYAGLALVALGIGLFIAEAFVPGVGVMLLGGAVCMILGSLMLFDSSSPSMQVSRSLIFTLTLTTGGITAFLLQLFLKAKNRSILSGPESLIGAKGEAYTALSPSAEGKVFVQGSFWNATAQEKISKGEKIIVDRVDGMTLNVKKM